MDRPIRIKVAQCLAYGFFFQFVGWLMRKVDVDLPAMELGGTATFALASIILVYGGYFYAVGRGLPNRFGWARTGAGIVLTVAAWGVLHKLVIRQAEKAGLNEVITGVVILFVAECLVFYWVDRKERGQTSAS